MKTRHIAVLCSGLMMSVVGCGNDQPPKTPDQASSMNAPASAPTATDPPGTLSGTTAGRGAETSDTTPPPELANTRSPVSPADPLPPLSDDQIIQVTHSANVGEIEQAKLAQSKAKDGRVKKLAAMMVKDHSDADAKGVKLTKSASLNPSPSPTSASLESDAQTATTNLKSQTGADFDKSYVDAQVKEHQAVLDTIDQKLIPNAKNAALKAYLADVRPAIAMHLQHAKDLQKDMQK